MTVDTIINGGLPGVYTHWVLTSNFYALKEVL